MAQDTITSKDLEKFGIVNPPSDIELAKLPPEVYNQLKDTLRETIKTSAVQKDTEEERQAKLDKVYSILGTGQTPEYGSFAERSQRTGISTEQAPALQTITTGAAPISATTALKQQQDISGRKPQTMANVSATIQKQMPQQLAEIGFAEQEIPAQVQAFTSLFQQLRINNIADKTGLNEVELYQEALRQYSNILTGQIPTLSEEQVDPEMQGLTATPYINAYSQQVTPGAVPDYTSAQLAYFENLNQNKIENYVSQAFQDKMRSAPRMFYVQKGDVNSTISQPVLEHIISSPTAAIVYSPEIDDSIREQYDATYLGLSPVKINSPDYVVQPNEARAMAKVEAIQRLDAGQWFQDPEQKKRILADVDKFKDVGIMETRTGLGGTAESAFGQYARIAFSPFNAFAVATQRVGETAIGSAMGAGAEALEAVGALPELPEGESYFDPNMAARVRMKERKEQAPLYAGRMKADIPFTDTDIEFEPDSVLGEMVDAVARNRGHLDFNTALADGLNIDGATKLGMQAAGFTSDMLSADMAVFTGAIKGSKAGASMYRAQKAVHDATSWDAAKKGLQQLERTFSKELIDDTNLISLTKRVMSPKEAKKLDNIAHADVRLYMADDMARNLEARELAKNFDMEGLKAAELQDTLYYKALIESGDAKRADDIFFSQMKQKSNKVGKQLEQYDEMQAVLDNARVVGFEDAVKQSRKQKRRIDYKYLEDIYKRAGKQPDVLNTADQINNAQRMLTTVVGRGMFFEVSPRIGDLENIVQITRNLFGTKQARTDLLATASRTRLSKSIRRVRELPAAREIKPAQFSSYKLYGDDLIAKQGRMEMSYNLDRLSPKDKLELQRSIQELDAPVTYRNYLMTQVDNNRIFESDLNELVMKNRDDVGIGRRDVFTEEEINKLPASQQKKLLEPVGSQARQDFRNGFIGQSFDKVMEGYNSLKGRFTGKRVLKETQTPVSVQVDTFQKQRMLEEVQKEVGQLDQRLNRDFKELVKGGPSIRAKYVTDTDKPLSKSEALGALIVGPRQVGSGVRVQEQEMFNTLKWMLDRCFYSKDTKFGDGASDAVTGLTTTLNSNIWTAAARPVIDAELQELARLSVSNPRRMWGYFQEYVNELDAILKAQPFKEFVDPLTGQTMRVRLVGLEQQYNTLKTVSNVELENLMEELTIGSYFHAEGNRINHRYLTDVVDKELAQLNVQNVLPGVEIEQDFFEQLVRETVKVTWRNGEPYEDMLRRVESLVASQHFDETLKRVNKTVGVNALDIEKSIYDDFDGILKADMKPRVEESTTIKKQLDDELEIELEDIRQRNVDIFDDARERLKQQRIQLEKTATSRIRQRANRLIEQAGRRSEEATKIRKEREQALKDVGKKYVKQYDNRVRQLRKTKNTDIERQVKQAVANNERQKQDIDLQIKEMEQSIRENFHLNMANKDVMEQLEWFTRSYSEANADFDKIKDFIKSESLPSGDIDKIARQSIDYGEVVLRNNKLDTKPTATLTEIDDMLSKVLGPNNEKFAEALLGSSYQDIRNKYTQQTITAAQQNIKKIIMEEQSGLEFVSKMMDIMTPTFYFFILGARTRFHGMNFITAPLITYQTLGRFSNPMSGFNVVRKGGRIGAKGADDIAVRSPDGLTFTNREIFELIERSGVKSEYNFIRSAMNDGSLLRFMKSYEKPGVGYSRWIMNNFSSGVEAANQFGTHTDMMWRSSVFIDAIKEGSSVEEALGMARRSLFDYNDLSEPERKYIIKLTVFWNFQRQNIASFVQSLFEPEKLKRFVRIYRLKRDMNAVFADINDGKRYPYEMYMPEYTQTRMIYGQQQGIANNRQLLMSPSIPALEAAMFVTDVLSQGPLPIVREKYNQLLAPSMKLLAGGKDEKYKGKRINAEYVSVLKTNADSPQEIADQLSLLVTGEIEPKFVGHNAVGNVDGYIYPLNNQQQNQWAVIQDGIGFIGATTAINDYVRAFAPSGTTYQGLSMKQRMLALTGVLTPARQKSIVDQQIMNLKRIRSELRKEQNIQKDLRKGAILSDVKSKQNPSEEQ
jgi:hypothetical protein